MFGIDCTVTLVCAGVAHTCVCAASGHTNAPRYMCGAFVRDFPMFVI